MTTKYNNVYINETATITGPYEKKGPLHGYFDKGYDDFYFGTPSWEQAESKLITDSIDLLLAKADKTRFDIDLHISGDLLNQITSSNFASTTLGIPYLGIYNACATSVEGLIIGANMIEAKQIKNCICTTSSHNNSAEKQFRYPVEYGGPKPKTATFTTTVTPSTTNIKATASGTAVGADGTVAAVTGYASPGKTAVLGTDATFSTSVTPSTTRIKATASGTAVGADGTASAVTGYAAPVTEDALGSETTFETVVSTTKSNIKATASGTTVGASGTDTFVKSYPGTTSKLATTTIKGVSGTTSASDVSHTSKKLATTTVKGIANNTSATLTLSMGSGNEAETLIIGGTGFSSNTYTATNTTSEDKTVATGSLVATSTTSNVGGTVVDTVTETARTVATANSSATTVATGSLAANASGATVMTGLGTATTASAVTGVQVTAQPTIALSTASSAGTGTVSVVSNVDSASTHVDSATIVSAITDLGTPTTQSVLTGVKVTAQPTIALATGAATGTGVISVATGISSASTTINSADTVNAITSLGTPTTSNVLTCVKVTSQPTIALATGATAGTGVISVATGISSASTTTNSKDEATAITALGAATAAGQSITVGTNDKVKVAKYTDLSVSVS